MQSYCASIGGRLPVTPTARSQDALSYALGTSSPCTAKSYQSTSKAAVWLGLQHSMLYDEFVWEDGRVLDRAGSTAFDESLPVISYTEMDGIHCVAAVVAGTKVSWQTVPCTSVRMVVCEGKGKRTWAGVHHGRQQ